MNDINQEETPVKVRVMSPRGFLHKSNGKAALSAMSFLAQYREWLLTGELATVVSPILLQVDLGELMPTPALRQIQAATLAHIMCKDNKPKAERVKKAVEAKEPKEEKEAKQGWVCTIYDAKREIQTRVNAKGQVEDLVKVFDNASACDRWADRRLFEGAPDWFAELTHTKLSVKTMVLRDDAVYRLLKAPLGAVCHKKSMSSTLGFGVKSRNDISHFSHG